jgi:murein tripeptide amidase MpaA
LNINRYLNNKELNAFLQSCEQDFPDLCQLTEIGKSYAGKPIWLLTLSNKKTGADTDKPALWIDANIHATELTGTTTVVKIIDHFLNSYGNDEHLTKLMDTNTIYLVPRINPDGAELAMSDSPQFVRSGIRPYPYQEKDEGIHQSDIDGDGRVLQMRIEDPNGDWKISALDPRLMEKRSPIEFGGKYYRILPEGLAEKFDGFKIKAAKPLAGLDFNRNFPFSWRTEGEQSGAGPYPGSEPEIKALIDFIIDHPNINIAITFHTSSRVILRPYSTKPDDEIMTEDLWVMKKIGEIGSQANGYRCISTFHDFKYHPKEVTTGAFDDWIYDHLGIFSYTIELWDLPTEAGIKDRKFIEWERNHPHEDDLKILKWVDENAAEDGYVNWYPFDHPQLGQVELGGWNSLYTWKNPPEPFLKQEAEKQISFMVSLVSMLPQISIYHLEATRLQTETYRIRLVVENNGFLPTFTSQQGKKSAVRPVRVALDLPDTCKLAVGKLEQDLGHLEGRSNKLSVTTYRSSSPTDNREVVEWTVQAAAGSAISVKVISERAGKISKTLTLP